MEATEAVLDLSAWPEVGWVMDVVGSLLDKSLVYTTEQGQNARFNLLVSVSEFAQQRCKDTVYAGVSSVYERHAEHYASMGRSDQLTKLFGREASAYAQCMPFWDTSRVSSARWPPRGWLPLLSAPFRPYM